MTNCETPSLSSEHVLGVIESLIHPVRRMFFAVGCSVFRMNREDLPHGLSPCASLLTFELSISLGVFRTPNLTRMYEIGVSAAEA
jgi:hypothetical protein